MKLITEQTQDLSYLTEDQDNGKKKYMIEGIFAQAESKNRNGRIYPRNVLESATTKYLEEQVSTGRAVGELGHPESPSINLDRVSHKITELKWDGDNVIGKAEILETPMGQIVRGLMDGNVQLGVSTRGMGSLKQEKGKTVVSEDFMLATVDVVQDPSCPDSFVDGIMENVDYWVDNGVIKAQRVDEYNKQTRRLSEQEIANAQIRLFQDIFSKY